VDEWLVGAVGQAGPTLPGRLRQRPAPASFAALSARDAVRGVGAALTFHG
jgi:hypothetical protein